MAGTAVEKNIFQLTTLSEHLVYTVLCIISFKRSSLYSTDWYSTRLVPPVPGILISLLLRTVPGIFQLKLFTNVFCAEFSLRLLYMAFHCATGMDWSAAPTTHAQLRDSLRTASFFNFQISRHQRIINLMARDSLTMLLLMCPSVSTCYFKQDLSRWFG